MNAFKEFHHPFGQETIVSPHLLTILFCAALFACAGQVPPSGGPVDTTPPTIIRTEPDTNAVGVTGDRIVLEFSEYVDRRSVEESVFISPYVGDLEFDWSGTEVTILFSEKLKPNTTYVVNIGTDVTDVRARNRMAHGYTLAFSTGDRIDQGFIAGKVFDPKPDGVMLFAYALSGMNPDTLDPTRTKPDYIMQTGKDGSFTFSNIRFDTYRLFAVRDQYRNLLYDKQVDEIGVPTNDVTLSAEQPLVNGVWFKLFSEDTTGPFLTRVSAISRRHVQLRFSEPLDSAAFTHTRILIRDTLTLESIGVMLQSLDRGDSTAVHVLTATPLDTAKMYRVTVEGAADRSGNIIRPAYTQFDVSGRAPWDSVKPLITLVGVRDSVTDIPLDAPIEVRFSEPVHMQAASGAASLMDSARGIIPIAVTWPTANAMIVTASQPFASRVWYTFRMVLDSVRDFWGNAYKDSVLSIRFRSLDVKTTGTIEGRLTDDENEDVKGEIVLTAVRAASLPPIERHLILREPGRFIFELLPEGLYTLRAYRDRDSSGSYTFGSPHPFRPAERFVVYSDTLKVRARWGVEGVAVTLKKLSGR